MKTLNGACIPVMLVLVLMICTGTSIGARNNTPSRITPTNGTLHCSTSHGQIIINGNEALDAFPNMTGIGTAGNPYVIENLEIDAGGSTHCIDIQNTDRWLVMRNCTVTGATQGWNAGIHLYNCTNVIIENCTAAQNFHGIELDYFTRNIVIHRINASNNADTGIRAGMASNTWTNFSISSTFAASNGWQGFTIFGNNNTMTDNVASNNVDAGYWIAGDNDTIASNRGTRNGLGFKVSCRNAVFSNNSAEDNAGNGFLVEGNIDNEIANNTITYNGGNGIYMMAATRMTVQGNAIMSNNGTGIFLNMSKRNIICNNVILDNVGGAIIKVNSSQNEIFDNDCNDCNDRSVGGMEFLVFSIALIAGIPVVVSGIYYRVSESRKQKRRSAW